MLRTKVALTLSALLLANSAVAGDSAQIDHQRLHAQTRALVEIQALTELPQFAVAPSKEFTEGCVTEPFPVQPTGPRWTARTSDLAGAQMDITAWRRPCGTAGDAQLLITVSPVSGTPFSPCRVEGAVEGDDPAGVSRIGACRGSDCRAALPAILASEAGIRRLLNCPLITSDAETLGCSHV